MRVGAISPPISTERSQKQDDGASAASKNDGGDESDLLEGFKGDSGAWSGSRLGKDESMLESEFDWESLPEAELRKHVRKILGRNDVGKFDGSRSLHPDLYELMTAAGPLTEQQVRKNSVYFIFIFLHPRHSIKTIIFPWPRLP